MQLHALRMQEIDARMRGEAISMPRGEAISICHQVRAGSRRAESKPGRRIVWAAHDAAGGGPGFKRCAAALASR